ncbi:MAG: pimeloyl-ACP methyl ester carboxylesterase [Vicingaceae bacterium]
MLSYLEINKMDLQIVKVILTSFLLFIGGNFFGQEVNREQINPGSGSFSMQGGFNHEKDSIEVHYYKPQDYRSNFSVIIVIPGGGRNGDGYRDKWIDLAEKYNLLVLSPSYSKKQYPKVKDYNLGRLSKSSLVNGTSQKGLVKEEWIFDDFDRIFDTAVEIVGSTEKNYDIFGHSAGGQIAHRLVLFNPNTKANRIVAANSGWYTLPSFSTKFPYGLKKTAITKENLIKSFSSNLVILIGELDNENETRGHLRNTREAKVQGSGRFSRGNFFYEAAIQESKQLDCGFLWKKKTINRVGHSSTKMSIAAAEYLYSTNN